jgi:mono/diheme cytochrome c family protein
MRLQIQTLLTIAFLALTVGSTPAADVTEIWAKNCVLCHGKDGSGNTVTGKKRKVKDFRDPKFQAELTDQKMIKTITDGIFAGTKERMESFGDDFTPEEKQALVAYIRKFKK